MQVSSSITERKNEGIEQLPNTATGSLCSKILAIAQSIFRFIANLFRSLFPCCFRRAQERSSSDDSLNIDLDVAHRVYLRQERSSFVDFVDDPRMYRFVKASQKLIEFFRKKPNSKESNEKLRSDLKELYEVVSKTEMKSISEPLIDLFKRYVDRDFDCKGESEILICDLTKRLFKVMRLSDKETAHYIGDVRDGLGSLRAYKNPQQLEGVLTERIPEYLAKVFADMLERKLYIDHLDQFADNVFALYTHGQKVVDGMVTDLEGVCRDTFIEGKDKVKEALIAEIKKMFSEEFFERGALLRKINETVDCADFGKGVQPLVDSISYDAYRPLAKLLVVSFPLHFPISQNFDEMKDKMTTLLEKHAPHYFPDSDKNMYQAYLLSMLQSDLEFLFEERTKTPEEFIKIRKRVEINATKHWNEASKQSKKSDRIGEIAYHLIMDKEFGNHGGLALWTRYGQNYLKNLVTDTYVSAVNSFYRDASVTIDLASSLMEGFVLDKEVKQRDCTLDLGRIFYDFTKYNQGSSLKGVVTMKVLGTPEVIAETYRSAVQGLVKDSAWNETFIARIQVIFIEALEATAESLLSKKS